MENSATICWRSGTWMMPLLHCTPVLEGFRGSRSLQHHELMPRSHSVPNSSVPPVPCDSSDGFYWTQQLCPWLSAALNLALCVQRSNKRKSNVNQTASTDHFRPTVIFRCALNSILPQTKLIISTRTSHCATSDFSKSGCFPSVKYVSCHFFESLLIPLRNIKADSRRI